MRILAAPDKFRGTLTAGEAAAAIARGCSVAGVKCIALPLADGGEGTVDAFGGANRSSTVSGPLGEPTQAAWRLDGELAVVETAAASGLVLAGGAKGNDPVRATSRGTGELIALARQAGARRIIVGAGGSACSDGGAGAVAALAGHGRLDGSTGFTVVVAADVQTPFVRAAAVFGAQKGADANQIAQLTRRLEQLVDTYRRDYCVDVTAIPGAGSAGGLAGGLAALGARVESGFDLIAAELGLDAAIASTDAVITGEGRLDPGSFDGKVVGGVLRRAAAAGKPSGVIAGEIATGLDLPAAALSLTEAYGQQKALHCAGSSVTRATAEVLAALAPTLAPRVAR